MHSNHWGVKSIFEKALICVADKKFSTKKSHCSQRTKDRIAAHKHQRRHTRELN